MYNSLTSQGPIPKEPTKISRGILAEISMKKLNIARKIAPMLLNTENFARKTSFFQGDSWLNFQKILKFAIQTELCKKKKKNAPCTS